MKFENVIESVIIIYSLIKILTVEAPHFSSQAAIDTFRIGWVTGHYTLKSFFDTNVTANVIKMVIPSKIGLNYQL